ncbi:hypothetical protein HMPREF0650_2181 [Hoylesella buccalis ATCC 35310]|uniref:Uncharacterized protein n=1 Tax=Hoylesella buccalis ATCC 35310 TaxID=679190 RepID=D1W3B0_9BACT|nr:hypothetical protein HMPREF0650_2181 [Hoylesella buccalis ATCC 35310]
MTLVERKGSFRVNIKNDIKEIVRKLNSTRRKKRRFINPREMFQKKIVNFAPSYGIRR